MFTLVIESALVGFLVSTLGTKLVNFAEKEIGRMANVENMLTSLKSEACLVQEKLDQCLRDQNPELISSTFSSWKGWVRKVTELCYDVDDILEDEMNQSHVFSALHTWGFASKLRKLLEDVRNIKRDLDSLNFSGTPELNNNLKSCSRKPPDSFHLPRGRQTDRDNIVGRLVAGSSTNNNKGVSILGRAGLGKTTLAESIVNDPRIQRHFRYIKWSSLPCDLLNNKDPLELRSTPPFLKRMFSWPPPYTRDNSIKTLWVVDSLEEYASIDALTRRTTPSRDHNTFLITSRDLRMATSTQTSAYYLKRMSDEECEELIKEAVYPGLSNTCDKSFFEATVRNIAKKSMGLPLVASLLGRTLHDGLNLYKEASEAIIYFEQTDLWELIGRQMWTSLRFDGKKLAPHMKKLAYFTLFPPDHLLTKDHLLQLWMAEGFVQPEGWTNTILAQKQLDEMLSVSMVEPSSNRLTDQGYPWAYQTNEIAHGFGRSMASNMCFRMDNDEHYSYRPLAEIDAPRHLSVCCQNIPESLLCEIAQHFKQLRTFLLLHQYGTNISTVPGRLFQKLVYLRVLDLSHSSMSILPSSIRNLKHLRYLDLSCTKIKSLPPSLCQLLRLVILKLLECDLRELPKKTGSLVNLVHLELGQGRLCSQPERIGKLTNLQTLNVFVVKKGKGYRINELKNLNALRGSIEIRQLENVDKEEAMEGGLEMKKDLRTLSLEWTKCSMPIPLAAKTILTHLQPHRNLSELRVTNYSGIQFPGWISIPSCHLRSIYLDNCPFCNQLPSFSNLPFLKTLHIESLPSISSIGRRFFGAVNSGFKTLERLEFSKMKNLYEFQELESGDMTSLRELKFECCPQLTVLSTVQPLSSLTYLEITRCSKLNKERPVPPSLEQYLFEGELVR